MSIPVPYTMFWCSSISRIPSVDEKKDILRYFVRKELKFAEKMEIFKTEEAMDEAVEFIRDFC